ncbi:hypothetical protein H4R24_001032 [Coemansia sp. RSA 988]|nr:hypothetical protein H4R24_001032 [Coemansia sp. RSA 988]
MAQDTSISETQRSQQQQQPQGSAVAKAAANASAIDTPTEKKDDKAAPVRKRLSLACTTCRQRKVKCDGGRPSCRTCAKFNWPCIYQPSNRKRGPRPRALALMDGSTPYSTRPHWSTTHSYYAYGMAGPPPMSPPLMPPPPPLHQMIAPMPNQRYMEMSQNGAPMRVDPAHDHMGGYNYDSYSSYSDYIASTGGIRIRPAAPPPLHHAHMGMPPPPPLPIHSPSFNPMSPPPGRALGVGGPARHRAGSHYQPAVAAAPHQPHAYRDHRASLSRAQDAPPYAQPHRNMAPEHDGPGVAFYAPHMAPMHNPPGLMHMPTAPLAGPEMAANTPSQQSAIKPPQGSTAPQHMHASAQSYARSMQLACHDAPMHTSAIYARPAGDAASSRSSSSGCGNPGAADCAGRFNQFTPPALHAADAHVLSSPVQQNGGYAPATELPRTAPIPSSSAFASYARHTSDCRDSGGTRQPDLQAQHPHAGDASEYREQYGHRSYAPSLAADSAASSHPPSQPLPFSDGLSRPRLPPLSEVLGKDYQLILPSGTDGAGSVVAKDPALPNLTSSHRKDIFSSEVSRMRTHENIR